MAISFKKQRSRGPTEPIAADARAQNTSNGDVTSDTDEKQSELEALYTRYHKALKLFVMTTVKCEQVAEEIAQESYLLFLKKHNEKVIIHPRAYLFRTASNLSIDFVRRDVRSVFDKNKEFQEEQVKSPHASPEDQAILNQTKITLEESLSKMPRKTRQVFFYRRYEEHSIQEISNIMNISERMVYKHLRNALRQLSIDLRGAKP